MVERVLEQQRAISDVLSADKKSRHLIPTWQDLDVLESINQALHPLQAFTDAVSGESYVSVSYVKPVLHLMKTSVLAEKDTDSDLTKSIKKKILNCLISKYDNPATQELLDITSFLDPRFKASYINADQVVSIKTRMLSEMETNAQKERRSPETETETRTNDPSSEPPKKAKKSLGSLFKTTSPPSSSVTHLSQAVEAELSSYMLSATVDSEEDPLAWWKLHHMTFPQLSKLARKYLCIPASSSPSERLFSTSGNVVTCQRTCLKPSKVNMLVFLAKNLQ